MSTLDVETILPYGETIRPLLAGQMLSNHDLKRLLNKKGIFLSSSEKEKTIPILSSCLLSPSEFELLREKQRSKENKYKRSTRKIGWDSTDTLFASLGNINLSLNSLIDSRHSNFELISAPRFKMGDDKNTLLLEYEIERTDTTRDWANSKSKHEGRVTLRKLDSEGKLEISLEHTANETKDLNEKIIKYLYGIFKNKDLVKPASTFEKITFGGFNNRDRIKFLLSLHGFDPSTTFDFKQVTNIEFGLDTSRELPDDIDWMKKKVKNMILKGEQLHDSIFLTDPKYHESLILAGIEVEYSFNTSASKGLCTIDYGFPSRSTVPDASTEFQFLIIKLSLDKDYKHMSKSKVTNYLMHKFSNFKSAKLLELNTKDKNEP